jgi:hypothetical protein
MPIREFLIARDNTFHELYKMRQKVLRLFRQITDLQYTETFARDVDSFLNKEVIPHVNEYNNKFAEHFLAFVKYASKFQWPLITAYISVAQSLGLADIALLSGASTVLGDLIYNLIDHMTFKDRNKFRNTFSYFINMKETCEECRRSD